ncbi:larval cuticle protein 65Ag1-like [Colias croceus]|uniref:larval cuticle protein 65Ag1-like n=1 Tax=Colias crocea TaxID=72248 RepID=UPI001E27F6CF|nr:larval cuticle protein 65Ag1-like [Colias croceus]
MKMLIVFCTVVAAVACAPTALEELAVRRAQPALDFEEVRDEFGQYALRYVTAEGIVVSERGHLVPAAKDGDYVLIVDGEFSYIGDDGQLYVTKFTSGLDGTHVEGNHLPVAPEPIVVEVPESQ